MSEGFPLAVVAVPVAGILSSSVWPLEVSGEPVLDEPLLLATSSRRVLYLSSWLADNRNFVH